MRCLAVVLLCLVWIGMCIGGAFSAQARQSPYPPVTQFNGDRYAGQAQMGPDVTREIGRQRASKARYLYPTRKRPPVARQRWKRVPVPAPRPLAGEGSLALAPLASEGWHVPATGASEPMTVLEGVKREVRRVAVQIVGGRPAQCPSRFCACALALKIFGRVMPGLNVAVTWAHKFPRVAPAPSMVAARHGHAFQLIAHVRGDVWRVWDANSGHGRIRVHERSIVGFVIVNPHGSG